MIQMKGAPECILKLCDRYLFEDQIIDLNIFLYFQAFTHINSPFKLQYNVYSPYINPAFGNKFMTHKSLRSWTHIIAHPTLPYFYVLGIENLTQYNVINGQFMWTANIAWCSKQNYHNQPLIYTDATFFKSGICQIYILYFIII